MKHLLELTPDDSFIILFALRAYEKKLEKKAPGEVPFIEMARKKLITANRFINLDGGEMQALIDALEHRADHFFLVERYDEQKVCLQLSKFIQLEKMYFQFINGPKIEKQQVRPTLTAKTLNIDRIILH